MHAHDSTKEDEPMRFKVIDRKIDRLICEDVWTDEIPMPIRGDSFTFDGGTLMRIMECIFIMEAGKIVRVTFLVEEDVPARVQLPR
jgi:hypothetical protein